MNFTDAVTVSGNPPVTPEHLRTCKRLLKEFAEKNGVPLPVNAEWSEAHGLIRIGSEYEGRAFAISAPKAH